MNDGWSVSSLQAQDMDSVIINNLFIDANNLDNLYSLIIVKNGYPVAEKYFNGMGITVTGWPKDANGYYYGSGDIQMTPRSLAKFGQLYLDDGVWNEVQFIPPEWGNVSFRGLTDNDT